MAVGVEKTPRREQECDDEEVQEERVEEEVLENVVGRIGEQDGEGDGSEGARCGDAEGEEVEQDGTERAEDVEENGADDFGVDVEERAGAVRGGDEGVEEWRLRVQEKEASEGRLFDGRAVEYLVVVPGRFDGAVAEEDEDDGGGEIDGEGV